MNSQPSRFPWPVHVTLEQAAAKVVHAGDGRVFELDAFRDACRCEAEQLRREAIAEATAAAAKVPQRLWGAAARLLRSIVVHRPVRGA